MNVKFAGETINVRSVVTTPGRFKCGDFLNGPTGLLRIITVQNGCPIWESNVRTKCQVLLETESGQKIPASDFAGQYIVLRPRKK